MLIPEARMLPVTAIPTPLIVLGSVYSRAPQENLPISPCQEVPVLPEVVAFPTTFEPVLTLHVISPTVLGVVPLRLYWKTL